MELKSALGTDFLYSPLQETKQNFSVCRCFAEDNSLTA